jgi:hypothetical protein
MCVDSSERCGGKLKAEAKLRQIVSKVPYLHPLTL